MKVHLPLCTLLLLAPAVSFTQERDYSKVEVKASALRGSTHMLIGAGGNMVASVGSDGTFLVDDQFAPLSDKIRATLATIDKQPVRFVLNTHWHGDHTGGNENFGKSGAIIVAHDNVRKRMSTEQFIAAMSRKVPASPANALPIVTFTQNMSFHINGDTVHIKHVANAHTDGDALVKFEKANVLHMGDTFFNGGYPFIDASSGGGINGLLAAIDAGLALCNDDTIVIPGHGERTDRKGLADYGAMLKDYRDRIATMKTKGKTLDQVIAAKPTASTDETLGKGFIKPEQFVRFVYETL